MQSNVSHLVIAQMYANFSSGIEGLIHNMHSRTRVGAATKLCLEQNTINKHSTIGNIPMSRLGLYELVRYAHPIGCCYHINSPCIAL